MKNPCYLSLLCTPQVSWLYIYLKIYLTNHSDFSSGHPSVAYVWTLGNTDFHKQMHTPAAFKGVFCRWRFLNRVAQLVSSLVFDELPSRYLIQPHFKNPNSAFMVKECCLLFVFLSSLSVFCSSEFYSFV